jgi:hypothetical protein
MRLYLLVCLVFLSAGAYAQTTFLSDTSAKLEPPAVSELTRKDLDKLSHKYDRAEKIINASSEKLLERLQRREQRMYDAVSARDSMAAKRLFTEAQSKYKDLQARLDKPVDRLVPRPLQEYVPRLDSLQTAMNFLGRMNAQLPADKIAQLQGVSGQLQQLEGRMQQAGEIQDFLRQREQLLKDNLTKFGMAKQLIGINKEAFYYQQQMAEYKKSLNDPEKMEQIALRIANASPVFQGFMQKHSYLGVLFPPPAHYNTSEALKDIPTSAEVGDMIAKKIGSAGDKIDARQYLAQQAGQGHDQLASLKDKISKAGGDNSSAEIPQFKPNDQKTRSLLHRLEFGFNIQSQGSTRFLPVTTDLAVTIGYKLNNNATAGVGAAYKLGWGNRLDNIDLSNQGIGLRSYLDVRIKGSFWITGGMEYNYMQEFSKWSDIKNPDIWQKSGLIGVVKKYKAGKRTANLQLLYDILAQYETPRPASVKFRVGYSF